MIRIRAVLTLAMAAAPNPCRVLEITSMGSELEQAHNSEVPINRLSPIV